MGNFLKRLDGLGRSRALAYLRILALVNLASLALLVASSRGGVDRNGFLLGTDFLSFWTTGRMLHLDANPYDIAGHIAAQQRFFARSDGFTGFFYPPSFLPFCWGLGFLGYFTALAVWLVATGAFYLAAVQRWWKEAGLGVPLWLVAAAFPPLVIVLTHGQTSFLVAGLLGLGVWCVPSRKVLAGIFFALATIKPQFGLLVPLALLAGREWKVIAIAALGALGLAGASAFLFGREMWPAWLAVSDTARATLDLGLVDYGKMVSVYAALRTMGAGVGPAYAVQGLVSLGVAAGVLWAGWRRSFTPGHGALLLAGAPLATPFVLDYDLVLIAFPLLWLTSQGTCAGWRDWEKLVVVLAFAGAAFARPLALHMSVPIMPIVLIALFALVLRRVSIERQDNKELLSRGHEFLPAQP